MYGGYIYSYWDYRPTYNWGGHHLVGRVFSNGSPFFIPNGSHFAQIFSIFVYLKRPPPSKHVNNYCWNHISYPHLLVIEPSRPHTHTCWFWDSPFHLYCRKTPRILRESPNLTVHDSSITPQKWSMFPIGSTSLQHAFVTPPISPNQNSHYRFGGFP